MPTVPSPQAALDWDAIDLVVFDVDGTLYDQRRLRLAMLRQLLRHAWRSRSLDVLLTLRTFRHVRESLGDEQADDFLQQQYSRTAALRGKTEGEVRDLTSDWMETRPLECIGACRYPHLQRVFSALRSQGKRVAVFSDYPATAKLAALGLQADPVVCATDPQVARLKPDPAGLMAILRETGVPAHRTLMVGDRFDRDAAAASAAGVRALIRSRSPHPEHPTFRGFDDAIFRQLLARTDAPVAA